MGKWTITVEGGPAFWANAETALRVVAEREPEGPVRSALERLATADASYEGDA